MKNTFLLLFIPLLVFGQFKNDPCFDYIKDGYFYDLNCEPQTFTNIECLRQWYNPSSASPNIITHPSVIGGNHTGLFGIGDTPISPSNTTNFIGLGVATPGSGASPKVSYIATNLRNELVVGERYNFEFYIGAAGLGFEGGDYIGNIVLLGCNSCSLPLNKSTCLEQDLTVINKKNLYINSGDWIPSKLNITFTASEPFNKLIIGPGCNPWPTGDSDGVYYILMDGICLSEYNSNDEIDYSLNNTVLDTQIVSLDQVIIDYRKRIFCFQNNDIYKSERDCNDCEGPCLSLQVIENNQGLKPTGSVGITSLKEYLVSKKRPFKTTIHVLPDGSIIERKGLLGSTSKRKLNKALKVRLHVGL